MENLLKFEQYFLKENRVYEYGCLMLDINWYDVAGYTWSNILNLIDKDDLYQPETGRYGLEDQPHITALYGLHEEVDEHSIKKKLGDLLTKPIDLEIADISLFENKDYDVVKIGVESTKLTKINSLLRELPHTNDYPEYNPHITVAYVKKGFGQKYKKKLSISAKVSPNFTLSLVNGDKINL